MNIQTVYETDYFINEKKFWMEGNFGVAGYQQI